MEALTRSLMARDTSAEAKLAAIRHAVGKALERGRYGALEEMVPLMSTMRTAGDLVCR